MRIFEETKKRKAMKRIFFLLLCVCCSAVSFAQKTGNEGKQWSKQDSLRLQQLLSGQVEIVIDDETQEEINRLFNPKKWKPKSPASPRKKSMSFETGLPRYYISKMDTLDGRGYIRLLPYGPFDSPEEEKVYIEIPINREYLASYDSRLEPAPAGKSTPSALMVGAGISATFDADKLLGIIFSKKMRAKVKNAKEAKAWKEY